MRAPSDPVRAEPLERRTLLTLVPAGVEIHVSTATLQNQHFPAAAADGDGELVVAWHSGDQDGSGLGIYGQRFNYDGGPGGGASGGEFRVNTFTTGHQSAPAVASDHDGDFVIVWQSNGQEGTGYEVYGQRYDAAGQPQGVEFRVNDVAAGEQLGAAVAMDADGDFVVAYNGPDGAGAGVFVRRFNRIGVAQGGAVQVNTFTTNNQSAASVAMDAGGDFVVAWQSYQQVSPTGHEVYARRFDASGAALGGEFRVNTFTTADQSAASVAMDYTGDFVVAWHSYAQDGSAGGIYAQRYDASAAAQGGEFRVNGATFGSQGWPSVAMDADGDFLVAYNGLDAAGYGVFRQSYNAAGAALGAETRVNVHTTMNQAFPTVAMDAGGDAVVAWTSDGQDGSGPGVYAQRFNEVPDVAGPTVTDVLIGGNSVAPGERVVQRPATLVLNVSEFLTVAGGALGANSAWNPNNYSLTRNGAPVPLAFANTLYNIPTRKHEVELTPAASFSPLPEGNYVVTVKASVHDLNGNALDGDLNGAPGGDFTRAFAVALPAPDGPEFRVNETTANRQRLPAVAIDADGDHVIVWQSQGQDGSGFGIYAQRYGPTRGALGGEFLVNAYTTGNQEDAAVAMDADGNFAVTWWGEGTGDAVGVFARRFSAAGVPIGNEFRVNSGTGTSQIWPDVDMADNGDFVIAWGSNGQDGSDYGVYARRYAATGAAIGSEFRVNTFTSRNQIEPAVAVDADGDFVIAWTSIGQDAEPFGFGVFAQRYNAQGIRQGGEFRVNTFTTLNQHIPDVASDDEGNFVVAWISDNQDGSIAGIYAQRYAASGAARGGEFRVNTTTTGGQYVPRVAMDADGDFVISWHGDSQDGHSDGTAARRYNAQGVALTGELRPNSFTTGDQFATAVAADDDGDFVIAWTSIGQDGSLDGVYAQRFAAGAAPAVQQASFFFDTWPHRLRYTFNQDVSAGLGTDDLIVRNLTTSQTIPSSQFTLSYDAATNAATFAYVGAGAPQVLPDGRYRATLLASGVTGPFGAPLPEDHVSEFFFLSGDANRDGFVNLQDFNILAANFGQSGRTFAQGNFDYDAAGNVNLADFNILAGRFGAAVAGATATDDDDVLDGALR